MLSLLKFSPISLDPRSLWDNRTKLKRQERLNRLFGSLNEPHELSQNLNAFELTILSTPAEEIVSRIAAKRLNWTARNVLKAFLKSAIQAHLDTNCLTEIMFEEAMEMADELDKEFAATGKLRGRLHGLPVSLKDQINVKGFDSTIGYSKYIGDPAVKNAMVVDRLVEEGAIPFTKTNVPQTLLSFECSNPIFGATHNPHRRGFTSGGSSGGEAALLASDGSCLGIGSDVGGSLRVPAHYSGCYSLKPCSGRIPSYGMRVANPGFTEISSAIGPMTRCWEDLVLLSQVLLDRPDPSIGRRLGLIPVDHFRHDIYNQIIESTEPQSLKFGYFTSDSVITASPPCQRAVNETVEALESNGYTCVEIDVKRLDILEGLVLFVGLTSADGYQTILSQIERDPIEWSIFLTTLGPRLPGWLRWITCGILKYLLKDESMAKLFGASRAKSARELQQWRSRKQAYCLKVRSYLWDELKLDGLICPTQAVPAIPLGAAWNKSFLAVSTLLWNLVDSSVGQMPITKVNVDKDNIPTNSEQSQSGVMGRATKGLPTAKVTDGLPIGIQVVCGQWEEEKALALMGVIEKSWDKRSGKERVDKSGSFVCAKRQSVQPTTEMIFPM